MKHLPWRALQFINYLIKGKSAHGIHSPFVYDVITNVIYNKTPFYVFEPLEIIRKELLMNTSSIDVQDHGAGSKSGRSTKRKISNIAKHSLKSKKYAQLLFRLAENKKCHSILELGTSLGLTTTYLSYACPKANITTIEGSENIAKVAASSFDRLPNKNIDLIKGRFDQVLPDIQKRKKHFDFIFIDGHHEEKACLSYFNGLIENNIGDESLVIIDDINWSPGMKKAWKTIKQNKKVTLTIDLFELGLVYFFRRNQKEHFTIRF